MLLFLNKNALAIVLLGFLLLCLMFGGAGREGRFAHGLLQASAGIGIAVLAAFWPVSHNLKPIKFPIATVVSLVVIALLHSIPLPERVWQILPGRGVLIDGFHALGVEAGPMPLSFDIEATLSTIGYALPPLFVMLLCLRIGLRKLKTVLPWFILFAVVATVTLGMTQLIFGSDSNLYFYEVTNVNFPVGTFANVNHFASFLLLGLPFLIFLSRNVSNKWYQSDEEIATMVAIVGGGLILVAGIVAAGSLAVYLMSVPAALAALFAIQTSRLGERNIWSHGGAIAILVGAIALVSTSPLLHGFGAVDLSNSNLSRIGIWSITVEAIQDHWPVGTGIGTYPAVIPLYEDPSSVRSTYIARAHNEYLQITMEAGVLGVGVAAAALSWLGVRITKIWSEQSGGAEIALKKVSSVSILVLVIHSMVDFPLRTPAIGVFFALLVALISMDSRDHNRGRREQAVNPKRVVL